MIGMDPILMSTETGIPVCKFDISHNPLRGPYTKTVWLKCTALKALAEHVAEYYRKGNIITLKAIPYIEPYPGPGGKMLDHLRWQVVGVIDNKGGEVQDGAEYV